MYNIPTTEKMAVKENKNFSMKMKMNMKMIMRYQY